MVSFIPSLGSTDLLPLSSSLLGPTVTDEPGTVPASRSSRLTGESLADT